MGHGCAREGDPPFLFWEMTDDGSGAVLFPLQPEKSTTTTTPQQAIRTPTPDFAQPQPPAVRDSFFAQARPGDASVEELGVRNVPL